VLKRLLTTAYLPPVTVHRALADTRVPGERSLAFTLLVKVTWSGKVIFTNDPAARKASSGLKEKLYCTFPVLRDYRFAATVALEIVPVVERKGTLAVSCSITVPLVGSTNANWNDEVSFVDLGSLSWLRVKY
jgi:hypothetical protein